MMTRRLVMYAALALAVPAFYFGTAQALVYLSQKPSVPAVNGHARNLAGPKPTYMSGPVPARSTKPERPADRPKHNGNDHYDGGPGIDTISFANARQPVSVNLAQGNAFGHDIGNDTIVNIENVIGGRGHDRIVGDDEDNVLDGGPGGSDFIDGGAGFDTAVFPKPRAAYRIARLSEREITVSDRIDTDTLVNVEALKFADGMVLIEDIAL